VRDFRALTFQVTQTVAKAVSLVLILPDRQVYLKIVKVQLWRAMKHLPSSLISGAVVFQELTQQQKRGCLKSDRSLRTKWSNLLI